MKKEIKTDPLPKETAKEREDQIRFSSEELKKFFHVDTAELKETLFPAPSVEWWQFWHPGSGIKGGLVAAVVAYCLFKLFF